MHHRSIPFSSTKRFTDIVVDYTTGSEKLRPFYQWENHVDAFAPLMQEKSKELIDRAALLRMLQHQYAGIPITEQTEKNILSFADVNTFCVVVAHQVNVFTGPLYNMIKTASAIQLCRTLKQQYPDKHFVPVFWQGSEDHDFAEINHAHIFNKTFTWETDQRGATGRFLIADMAPLVQDLIATLGDGPFANHTRKILEEAYLQSDTLALAGRKMLNDLFGRFGLVVINGDDKYAKSVFADIMRDELLHGSSAKLVRETLKVFPYPPQANPRDINLFYLSEHGRNRILSDDAHEQFQVKDTNITFSREQIISELQQYPERFSPNVILRPVFQQRLLPSVAFIGGGGEVAYWLQLRSLFAHHQVQYPMVLLRDSFMLVDHATSRKMQKLHLQVEDLCEEENTVMSDYVRKNGGDTLRFDTEREIINNMLEGLKAKARQIDSSMDSAVMAEGQAMLNSLQKLESKLLKAEKAKMEVQLTQLKSIMTKLFPSGSLQERYDNVIPWFLKFGPELLDLLVDNSSQPHSAFHVLTEE